MGDVRGCQRGFSVLEMILVLIIFAILGAIGIPAYKSIYTAFNKRNAEIQVLQDLRLAQATAVEQGCMGIWSILDEGESYSFGCDYVPYSGSLPPVADTELFYRYLPNWIRLAIDEEIIFNSRGQVVDELGFLTTRSLTLSASEGAGYQEFNSGTLTATGFFAYAH